MQEFFEDDLTLIALPLYFLAIGLEAWWARRKGMAW